MSKLAQISHAAAGSPRGPAVPPEDVAHAQRQRILRAMVSATAALATPTSGSPMW